MHEAYHRALMAFPDEDVVVGSRFVLPDALDAFEKLDQVTPVPRHPCGGRGAGVGSPARQAVRRRRHVRRRDASSPINGQSAFLDFESAKPEKIDREIATMFGTVDAKAGDAMVVYGWTMAEDLVKLGQR